MKLFLPISIILLSLAVFSCRKSLGVCALGYSLPDGPGMESELKRFEWVGMMDTLETTKKKSPQFKRFHYNCGTNEK